MQSKLFERIYRQANGSKLNEMNEDDEAEAFAKEFDGNLFDIDTSDEESVREWDGAHDAAFDADLDEEAAQQSAWKRAGLDDDSLDDMGNIRSSAEYDEIRPLEGQDFFEEDMDSFDDILEDEEDFEADFDDEPFTTEDDDDWDAYEDDEDQDPLFESVDKECNEEECEDDED